MASPAVALFVDRARAVRYDFALTEGNAAAVVAICRRLDGLPLAIELAAARTRLLDPGALLGPLSRSLDALGTGTVDLPERQRTLRVTVEWSVGLLGDAERSLLEIMAIFAGGWTVGAAAEVAGLAEDRMLDLTEALARHSLPAGGPPACQCRHQPGPRCPPAASGVWPPSWMQPRSANGAGHACAGPSTTAGCLRRRMWPLTESAGSPFMWLGRRSCGMAGMRCACSSPAAHTTYGPAQIPGLGIAGQFCHDLRERHAAGFVTQRLRCARGLA